MIETIETPLVVLDLETTGTAVELDRIVQLGCIKITPYVENGQRMLKQTEFSSYINPTIPIPPEATAVHHITDAMVTDAPRFREVSEKLAKYLRGCDYLGYNLASFDLRMLDAEFRRHGELNVLVGRVIDVYRIRKRYRPNTLEAAVREDLGREPTGAHDALVDCRNTLDLFRWQLGRYPDMPRTVEEFHKVYFETPEPGFLDVGRKLMWRSGRACVNFGKHNGRYLEDVPRSYLEWIVGGEFDNDFKRICQEALSGRFPGR